MQKYFVPSILVHSGLRNPAMFAARAKWHVGNRVYLTTPYHQWFDEEDLRETEYRQDEQRRVVLCDCESCIKAYCPDGGRCWHKCDTTDKGLECYRQINGYASVSPDGWPK